MVSMSLENPNNLASASKNNQADNKALNEVAHETIEDFIAQVGHTIYSWQFDFKTNQSLFLNLA